MQIFSSQGASGATGTGVAGQSVAGAIRSAASATGTSFDYLLTTARVESGLNPQASARTSSARGLFQFIDSTWLATVKQAGPSLGYSKYADAIGQNADGSYSVSDPAMRQQISDLRDDPAANAAMAGAFTSNNAAQLSQALGRKPTDGELYIAHFMGANGASKLITAATNSPDAPAAELFPKAAEANRSIFYDRQGGARSVTDVYSNLLTRYGVAHAATSTSVAALQTAQMSSPVSLQAAAQVGAAASADMPTTPAPTGPLFYNMFSSDERKGAPVSPVVQDLWATRPTVAAALTGQPAPEQITTARDPVLQIARSGMSDKMRNLFSDLPSNVRGMFSSGS